MPTGSHVFVSAPLMMPINPNTITQTAKANQKVTMSSIFTDFIIIDSNSFLSSGERFSSHALLSLFDADSEMPCFFRKELSAGIHFL
jgi:hypothetical protein